MKVPNSCCDGIADILRGTYVCVTQYEKREDSDVLYEKKIADIRHSYGQCAQRNVYVDKIHCDCMERPYHHSFENKIH